MCNTQLKFKQSHFLFNATVGQIRWIMQRLHNTCHVNSDDAKKKSRLEGYTRTQLFWHLYEGSVRRKSKKEKKNNYLYKFLFLVNMIVLAHFRSLSRCLSCGSRKWIKQNSARKNRRMPFDKWTVNAKSFKNKMQIEKLNKA